ncbi:ATP-binding protein [[Flexibacter] sp. ATCC 35208]|uniref:ATP-binding protein n=1 Tax=[Flexibacter] sp. ATCC 35208 TaxID=1936242 RepID=UPI0009CC706D|nr:ATP-binding protein [[Flexibacter] sp. ATCC 35208]OMP74886.1 hypothetical protein BW716_33005 [[Flexibacter] sp. ATCC 35208]
MLTFSDYKYEESEEPRPVKLTASPYPYSHLQSDRRFEHLVFSIFKVRVEKDALLREKFDQVQIMNGVGEQGRDGVLLKHGKIRGAIQCKKHKGNVGATECITEILKFVLYSLINSDLIPDAKDFTYYFVVSHGFTNPASDYLHGFNQRIVVDKDLEKYFITLTTKYKSLSELKYAEKYAQLIDILAQMKIVRVTPEELDIYLQDDCRALATIFFEVQKVVDNAIVEEILAFLKSEYKVRERAPVEKESILAKFADASTVIANYPDQFGLLENSHIKRKETADAIDWLSKSLDKDAPPLLLVAGDPGLGKTVIIKELYHDLVAKGIPAIAIKSDRYAVSSPDELYRRLNLGYPLAKMIGWLQDESFGQVVVLVDQIDALSQAVASKRTFIDAYNVLISELRRIAGVRIIISVRNFDLKNDPEFSPYRGVKSICVQPLSKEYIAAIVTRIGLRMDDVSDKMLKLLSIPNHLDVLCRIYTPTLRMGELHSIHDLYDELWKQKALADEAPADGGNTCYELARLMYEEQVLSIPESMLSEPFRLCIFYLQRAGLLTSMDGGLQFFHQSFYDYVYAKHFVTTGQNLPSYIQDNKQSLFIRPAVKMILSFLRTMSPKSYTEAIEYLLVNDKVRFHLKLLTVQHLAFPSFSTKYEKAVIRERVLQHDTLGIPFMEAVNNEQWIKVFINEGHLNNLLHAGTSMDLLIVPQNLEAMQRPAPFIQQGEQTFADLQQRKDSRMQLWYATIYQSFRVCREETLTYLKACPTFPGKKNIILRLLNRLFIWDYPIAFQLFDEAAQDSSNWYDILHILEHTFEYNFDWSLAWLDKYLENDAPAHENTSIQYNVGKCIEKMFDLQPEKAFDYCFAKMMKRISTKEEFYPRPANKIYDDGEYSSYDFDRDHLADHSSKMLHRMIQTMEQFSREEDPFFRRWYEIYKHSNALSVICVMMQVLAANPKANANITIEYISHILPKDFSAYYLSNPLTKLLPNCFNDWTFDQQEAICNLILSIQVPYELSVRKDKDRYLSQKSYYGLQQAILMAAIPREPLAKHSQIFKKVQELVRRHPDAKTEGRRGSVSVWRGGPPMKSSAYSHMTLSQWEESMLKYNRTYERDNPRAWGGILEHSRAFEAQVKEKPAFFIRFIEKLIVEQSVVIDYIISGLNGLKASKYAPEELRSLFHLVIGLQMEQEDRRQLIWLTRYFIDEEIIDDASIDFLCDVTLHDSDPSKSGDPKMDILNSNRCLAVNTLIYCYDHPGAAAKIYSTILQCAKDPIHTVRVAAMYQLGYFLYVDRTKTLELFYALLGDDKNEDVYEMSVVTAAYLSTTHFEQMLPYLEAAILMKKAQKQISRLLCFRWFDGYEKAYTLLQQLLAISTNAKDQVISLAFEYYNTTNYDQQEKCSMLFNKFLQKTDENITDAYNLGFLHMEPEQFDVYVPLIKQAMYSNTIHNNPEYFLKYLLKCCKKHPVVCLDAVTHYKKYRLPNHFHGPHHSSEDVVKIVIGAYNALYEQNVLDQCYVTLALDLLDELLQFPEYRGASQQAINTI